MANNIAYASVFQSALDKVIEQTATTSWMTANASRVQYNGGKEVKIGKLTLSDLSDYSRATGFEKGDIDLVWQTHSFAYDRGRKFTLDPMDIDESNFVLTASEVMGEFARTKVVPEVDLVRIAKLSKAATPVPVTATEANALELFLDGIVAIRDAGYSGQLVAHVRYDFMKLLQLRFANQLSSVTFAVNGVDTTFPAIDGVALIPTVSGRMWTDVEKDVVTKAITPAVAAKQIEFLIAGSTVPLAIAKHEKIRTFSPEQYQDKNAWSMDYRLYHDLFVEDNQVDAVYVATKAVVVGP